MGKLSAGADAVITSVDALDASLIERLVARDTAALGELYDRYGRLALSVAWRVLGEQQPAEDVVQDVFLAIWRSASTFRPERGSVRGWLLTSVRNRAVDRLRRARGLVGIDEFEPILEAPNSDLWAAVNAQELAERVRRALAELPTEQRQVIELAYWGGLSQVEIADRVGAPLGTIKGRARLALAKLRASLSDLTDDEALSGVGDD